MTRLESRTRQLEEVFDRINLEGNLFPVFSIGNEILVKEFVVETCENLFGDAIVRVFEQIDE